MEAFRYDSTVPTRVDGGMTRGQVGSKGQQHVQIVDSSGSPVAAPTTGTITVVNDTNADGVILAANASRKGATIWNDSTAILYLNLSAGVSSATNCTVKMIADAYYEVPAGYTGIIRGIWASDASGAARVTELT